MQQDSNENQIKGFTLASILLIGALISPIPISFAQTDSHSSALDSISSFSEGVVVYSSSSTVGEILREKIEALDAGDITNLGLSVKEAAHLHKLLDNASKEERDDFKKLFHEFKRAVKLILNIGQGNPQSEIQDFSKKAIKLEKKIEKLESKDEIKNKIKYAIELSKKQRELQRLKNHIVTQESFLADGADKDKLLWELNALKKESFRDILIIKATKNGKELTPQDLEKIDNKVEKKISKSNDKKGS